MSGQVEEGTTGEKQEDALREVFFNKEADNEVASSLQVETGEGDSLVDVEETAKAVQEEEAEAVRKFFSETALEEQAERGGTSKEAESYHEEGNNNDE